jgi:hypothetical protein
MHQDLGCFLVFLLVAVVGFQTQDLDYVLHSVDVLGFLLSLDWFLLLISFCG